MLTKKNFRISLTAVLVIAAVWCFLGCDSKSTMDSESPSGSQISISATPTIVTASETSIIEATVTLDGSAVADQVVHFTVSPSSAGSFVPEYDTTDASGVAAVVFTASTVCTATVTATVVSTSLSTSVGLSVMENDDPTSGSGNINVSVSRSLLLADGQDTSVVTIVVTDDLGQAAPDSTLVKLAAGERFIDNDGNGYWSDGIDSLVFDANSNGQWDPLGIIPSTVRTVGGIASASYISGDQAYTVYVKITVDDGGFYGSTDVAIQLTPNATLNSIYMASDSLSLSVQGTGGIETGTVRAIGYDINGNPVPEGLPIVFVILDGPGGGESLDTLDYGPDTAITNSLGVATTTLHSGTVSGTVRIRAYSGTVLSNATQALIAAGPPAHIVIGADNCNVPYWDDVAGENAITAVVSDIYLNPVNDSTVVYFSTDEGTMMSHQARTEDGQGIAYSTWFSGNNVDTADGIVIIMAETAGGTVADTGAFINSHIPDTLIIYGMESSIQADGQSKITINVVGLDLNGNPVEGGTSFEADANYLGVSGSVLQDGCYSSSARIKVTSATLDVDNSRDLVTGNDDGIGAVDLVQFWYGGSAYSSFYCSLLTGAAYSGNSMINGEGSCAPGEVLRFSVSIADRWGNPLADHTLQMIATDGVVTGGTQETDSYGEAFGFVWTAPGTEGDVSIVVTDTDPRGGIILTKTVAVSAE